jgi:hypothetical protein
MCKPSSLLECCVLQCSSSSLGRVGETTEGSGVWKETLFGHMDHSAEAQKFGLKVYRRTSMEE